MLLPNFDLFVQLSLVDTHVKDRRIERKDAYAQNGEHFFWK